MSKNLEFFNGFSRILLLIYHMIFVGVQLEVDLCLGIFLNESLDDPTHILAVLRIDMDLQGQVSQLL